MSLSKDVVYLKHIEEALNNILIFSVDKSVIEISGNYMLSYAIARGFEIMGEASTRISKGFKKQYSDIPWRDMSNMRNRLIHNYFEIDYSIIWSTIKENLPDLKKKVDNAIKTAE